MNRCYENKDFSPKNYQPFNVIVWIEGVVVYLSWDSKADRLVSRSKRWAASRSLRE